MRYERLLTRWSLVVAAGKGPYLAGNAGLGETRVSTPVVSFDPDGPSGPEALTASGQRYVLLGNPDPENGVAVFVDVVSQRYDLTGSDPHAVTYDEAREMIRANEGLHFPRPEASDLPDPIRETDHS